MTWFGLRLSSGQTEELLFAPYIKLGKNRNDSNDDEEKLYWKCIQISMYLLNLKHKFTFSRYKFLGICIKMFLG